MGITDQIPPLFIREDKVRQEKGVTFTGGKSTEPQPNEKQSPAEKNVSGEPSTVPPAPPERGESRPVLPRPV